MTVQNWWLDSEQLRLFEARLAAIKLDRRGMLRFAAAAGGVTAGVVAAACAPAAPPSSTSAPAKPTGSTAQPTAAQAAAPQPTVAAQAAASSNFPPTTGVLRFPQERDPLHFDFNADQANYGDTAVFAGLGKFSPDLKAVPDMAESWESNADGSVWTFHIRNGAKWTNGDPVTANDFEWSWKRQLDPETKTPYAAFLYDLKNAQAFNKGEAGVTRDAVGIKATDDQTLVATMEGPRAYFPVLAAFSAALPAHRASVEKFGNGLGWTTVETGVWNGPFKLSKWEHNKYFELARNDTYWNAPNIKLQRVIRPIMSNASWLLAYENGEVDWVDTGPIGELKRIKADPKLSKELVTFSLTGMWYLVPHVKIAPFDNKQVRLAMAHAIDREAIVNGVLQGLGQPAYTLNPPGFPGYNPNKYDELTKYDPKLAMDTLKGTPYEGGKNWPKITLTQRDEGDAPKAAGEAIVQMLKQNLGMQMDHEVGDPKIVYERMWKGEVQLMWIRWYADYPDPNNMQYQVFYGQQTTGHRQVWQNDAFDKLVTDAKGVTDPEKRFKMYQDADQIMLQDGAAIFVYYPYNYGLLKPQVQGMPKNSAGDFVPHWNLFQRMYEFLDVK